MDFFTLNDFDLKGKIIGVRIDLNSDLDEKGELEINERFYAHSNTIKELVEKNCKLILIAHQSRKGEKDFIPLEKHSKLLSKVLGYDVKFVNDVIGEKAKRTILNLKQGEILLLDNVRFLEDEDVEKSAEEHVNSSLVKFLSPLIDFYIMDAFSVAHRSHSSIVGFSLVKPVLAGKVMEEEVEEVKKAMNPLGINAWIMGGAKIDDCISVLKYMFEKKPESIEKVLTGGMLANLLLLAKGYDIGSGSLQVLEKKDYLKLLEDARFLIENFEKEIVLPKDVAFEEEGERKEENIENLPSNACILDIGSKTIDEYKNYIEEFRSIIVKGPMGKFEQKGFEIGTKEILERVANSDAISLIGGGDTSVAIEKLGIEKQKFSYISVGGGALITFLSGKKMPGIEALKISFQKFKYGKS
ncbi:MAG: phosphoglycerate kinase [Candidatus Aenigmatarchaeota archaeon]